MNPSTARPPISRQGKANPIACILSFAMALRYSFDMGDDATRVEKAVEKVLADGVRTADLMGPEGGVRFRPARWAMP
jgi:3-isopropylmalate dehydrogenase